MSRHDPPVFFVACTGATFSLEANTEPCQGPFHSTSPLCASASETDPYAHRAPAHNTHTQLFFNSPGVGFSCTRGLPFLSSSQSSPRMWYRYQLVLWLFCSVSHWLRLVCGQCEHMSVLHQRLLSRRRQLPWYVTMILFLLSCCPLPAPTYRGARGENGRQLLPFKTSQKQRRKAWQPPSSSSMI